MPTPTRLATALLLAAPLLAFTPARAQSTAPTPALATAPAATAAPVAAATSAAACTDFDAYANGAWQAATPLPADRARIGSFDALRVANDRVLEAGLAELAANPARQTTPGLKLLAAQYRAGMDMAGIERRGLSAVQPWLARIQSVERDTLPTLIGELARLQISAPLQVFVGTDAKDATRHALQLSQAGLGLPDRDDYFATDDNSRKLQAAYRAYAERLLKAAGAAADAGTLDALMAFEQALAQASMTRVQRRDPNAIYNVMTPASLKLQLGGLAAGLCRTGREPAPHRRPAGFCHRPGHTGRPGAAGHLAHLPARARARRRGRVRPAGGGARPLRLLQGRHPRPEGGTAPCRGGDPDGGRAVRRRTAGRNPGRAVRREGVFTAGAAARAGHGGRHQAREAAPHRRAAVDERTHQGPGPGQAGGHGGEDRRARDLENLRGPGAPAR